METFFCWDDISRSTWIIGLLSTSRRRATSINVNYDGKRKLRTTTWKFCTSQERRTSLRTHYPEFGSIYYVLFQHDRYGDRSSRVTRTHHWKISSRRWREKKNRKNGTQL